ncbi:MAG: family 20 glycosylhydrolase [Flavobacteriales bacterium]|nr:family 20 glycosylhydrolase [Flavobacteriales bacterium]
MGSFHPVPQLLPFLFWGLAHAVSAQSALTIPSLIPLPVEVEQLQGECALKCPWSVTRGQGVTKALGDLLQAELDSLHPPPVAKCEKALEMELSLFQPDTILPPETYWLTAEVDRILIQAPTEEGLFRGTRTLIQLLESGIGDMRLPCLRISDHPRFAWRGMHLDVARHFFPVSFVKHYIDLLARYRMNTFHWHLTDDQGWRIEIKKYPKLTEVGAWRKGSQVGPYNAQTFDTLRYGGFYTQDEIREVVAYATARHINVVPEIEMPGHALAALAAYPELSCSADKSGQAGGPFTVEKGWGVFPDVFCPKEETFTFLENVLSEVLDLFPSPYVHIGGDECPKERWHECASCQARMQEERLKDEHELQSYFIRRIEQFVNSKGRKIIGWDEILEGGLAPNAAVMSWRGTEGGVAAAKAGHFAVMSPGSHCYFDHYQGDPANEPLAIGGYTTVQKVYAYEPVPEELNAEQARYILGAQGNVWTEYILTEDHVEYMAVPRMLALSEVLWSPAALRNETDFLHRLKGEFPKLERLNVNAAQSMFDPVLHLAQGTNTGEVTVTMECPCEGQPFVLDARSLEGVPYTGAITVKDNLTIRALCKDIHGNEQGRMVSRRILYSKATARNITLDRPPNEKYADGGAFSLVDGITAGARRVNHEWLGWRGEEVTITVDLDSVQDLRYLGIGALNEPSSWIHAPEAIAVSTSLDGITFEQQGNAPMKKNDGRREVAVVKPCKARYVRYVVRALGSIPTGQPGAGQPAWLFLDEVIIN